MNEKLNKTIHVFIILILIISASYGLIVISKFTAMQVNAQGGTITELIIEFTETRPYWAGVAGVAVRVQGFTSSQSVDLDGNTVEKENLLFDCLNPDGEQEIYASHVPYASLDTSTLTAATTAEIDAYIGIANSTTVSAANTYTDTTTITFGAQSIVAPSTTTYTINLGPSEFTTAILKDVNDNLIFASILTNFTDCFDTGTCNFQQILPIVNGTNQTYYYWADPSDDCPAGDTGGAVFATVYGNVSDTNGVRLENTIVDVAGYTTVSDATGFYNLTTIVGTYNIYGILVGYQTYNSNVTTNSNTSTVHNIVMVEDQEENPFTGVGPGEDDPGDQTETGIGPGVDVGPGADVGPGEAPVSPVIEEPKRIEGKDYIISLQDINRKIRIGNFMQEQIKFFSFKKTTAQVTIELNGSVTSIIELDKTSLTIDPDGVGDLTLTFFGRGKPGIYNGTLKVDGDMNASIPIWIELLPREQLPVEALLLDIETSEKNYVPKNNVKFKADLRNMLIDQSYPVQLFFSVQNDEGDETIWTETTNVFLRTGLTIIKNFEVPKGTPPGDYILRISANYLGLSSGSSTIFKVILPWYSRSVFGLPIWGWLLILGTIGLGVFLFFYIRKK